MIARLLILLALMMPSLASAQERERFVFAAISTESSEASQNAWQPFIDAMSETTGYQIDLVTATDYAGVIEALRFGQADMGWFSTFSGLQAIRLADAEVFAKTIYDTGEQGYYSVITVRTDSPLQSVEDLLVCDGSLSFGLGDPNSTSGTVVPSAYLFAPRGVDPTTCFSEVTNANHVQNAQAVANGFLDAATNNTQSLANIEENYPELHDQLRILWTSPIIPTEPLIWRRDIPEAAKARILEFYLTYGFRGDAQQRAREQAVLGEVRNGGFLPASNDHLLQARRLQLIRNMAEIEADEDLTPEEKAEQLSIMRAELDEISEAERRVATQQLRHDLIEAREDLATDEAESLAEIDALIDDFIESRPPPVTIQVSRRPDTGFDITRAALGLFSGLALFAVLLIRSAPPRYGPARVWSDRFVNAAIWSGLFGLMVWSFWPAQMFKLPLLVENAPRMGEYLAGFTRPDFGDWELYARQTLVTVQIALWGTVVAVVLAIPFGLLASRNIAPVWVVQPVRRLMDLFRSINELVVAAIFVAAVGLGPFAGVMALAVHTTGVLAKLFSEAVESIDNGPVEGVRATGAGPVNEVVWAVIPQVLPLWASYSLYRFESNTRSATILGLIGAGGIGQLLIEAIRSFSYAETAAILMIIIIAVVIVDMLSQVLRRRLI